MKTVTSNVFYKDLKTKHLGQLRFRECGRPLIKTVNVEPATTEVYDLSLRLVGSTEKFLGQLRIVTHVSFWV